MPAVLTVLYDASVLYPAPLRDLLMELALADLYRAKWTARIHDEWMESLLKNRPELSRARLARTRAMMDLHVRDCLVEDYEDLIETIRLPDPDDRHVLAAAIRGKVDVIVTCNLKHFPAAALEPHQIEAQHPDEFVGGLLDRDPAAVHRALGTVRRNLKNPPKTAPEYLDTLERQGLPKTVSRLRHTTDLF